MANPNALSQPNTAFSALMLRRFRIFSKITSAVAILVGGAVLVGWMFNIAFLKSILPNSATMKVNTAIAFVLLGVSLWHRLPPAGLTRRWARPLGYACAILVALIGALTLAEYGFNRDFGIDQLLFKAPIDLAGAVSPGRMGPNTAFNFLMLGLALLTLDVTIRRYPIAQFITLLTIPVAMLALTGYLYGVEYFFVGFGRFTEMALHTAITFLVVGLGILSARPERGPMSLLSSDAVGGAVARRLLPAVVVMLVIAGWLRLQGERLGLYPTAFGTSLLITASITLFGIVIWWVVEPLNRVDLKRWQAEAARQRANDELSHANALLETHAADLARTNRALRTLSDCNQELVRAESEADLLNQICRIIVETGGYQMAWVGYAENDEAKTVRPAAHAGVDENPFSVIGVTWANTESGQVPMGIAIRTGQPHVVRITTDPAYEPWRVEALQRGYAMCMAFPLIAEGRAFGGLGIFAVEPNAFDDAEVKLLTELANDLAFGVTALRLSAERAHAEAALRESEERFRLLVAGVKDYAIFMLDPKGTVVSWNAGAERIKGYRANEIIGQHFSRFYLEADARSDKPQRDLAQAATEGRYEEEGWRVRQDGSQFWANVLVTALHDETGQLRGFAKVTRDITERKQAEEALAASERRFRALVENSDMLVNLVNREGVFIYVSPPSARVVGYTPEEMVGRRAVEFLHPDEIEDPQRPFSRMFRQPGVTVQVERRVLHKDGSWRWVEGYSTNLIDDPAVGALVFNYRDITDRKRAEEQLRANSARATILAEISQSLAEVTSEPEATLDLIAWRITELMSDACIIRLLSQDGQYLDPVAVYHRDPKTLPHMRELYASSRLGVKEGFAPRIFQTGQALLMPTITNEQLRATIEPRLWPLLELYSIHSLIITPLRSQSRIIGLLSALRIQPDNPYTEADRDFLQDLADRSALAITNATLYQDIQHELAERLQAEEALRLREQHNLALLQLGKELEQAHLPAEALGAALTQVKAVLGYQVIWAYLVADDNTRMSLITVQGSIAERVVNEIPTLTVKGDAYLEEIIAAHDVVLVEDARTDPRTNKDIVAQLGNRTILNAPMLLLERKIGALGTGSFGEEGVRVPTRAQLDFFSAVASYVAVALNRIRLLNDLQEAQASLRQFNADLEQRVAERTTQLKIVNRELGQAKSEAEQARAAAEAANQAKSEFLSRMSHELRTPLNAILGFAQILGMEALNPDHQEGLKHILASGRHLLTLINEVLDIARIETGQLSLSPEPVLVSEAVHEALDLIKPLADQRSIQLQLIGISDQYVRADHQRLKQVLLNLLSNAVKYNHPGGRVTVTSTVRPEAKPGELLRLEITDTGRGIPANKVGRLFTPFDRLDADEASAPGTGLGLALSKNLVEAMGGVIGAKSVIGQGSTFWVEMPLVEAPKERLKRTGSLLSLGASPLTKAKTVLYIEDNLSNQQLVEQILAYRPTLRLITTMQGRLSVDLAREHQPALILLDLNLPDLHGGQVLNLLQADARTQPIPVVVISADATPNQIERLLTAGAKAYLTKPFDVKQFLQVIDELLA